MFRLNRTEEGGDEYPGASGVTRRGGEDATGIGCGVQLRGDGELDFEVAVQDVEKAFAKETGVNRDC